MASAQLGYELTFQTPDEKGTLAKVTHLLSQAGVNILAVAAYGEDGKGHFRMVVSDNAAAIKALAGAGIQAAEQQMVFLELENKTGALDEALGKLAKADVSVCFLYATAGEADTSLVILTCGGEDDKAVEALS